MSALDLKFFKQVENIMNMNIIIFLLMK